VDTYQPYILIPIILVLVVLSFVFFNKIREILKKSQVKTKLAKDEVESKSDYVSTLVHDLRSPLSVIKGASDMLLSQGKELPPEDFLKLVTQVSTTTDEILKMVNNILDVSKIEAGKFELTKSQGDLSLILQTEMDCYLPLAEKRGIEITTNIDPGTLKFSFDVEKVKRVLNNLMSNALKYTPDGGKITLTSRNLRKEVEISVGDSGPGVPDEVKQRLFHKFVQGDQKHQGTGLGLLISRAIIEAHGGKIKVENNAPKGAKFIFTLPII